MANQAPQDFAAGGGGGACVSSETGGPGEPIEHNGAPCCNNLGWFRDGDSCVYDNTRTFCGGAPVPSASQCEGYVPNGSTGAACTGDLRPGNTWVATNVAEDGTQDFCCIQVPVSQCYWFTPDGTLQCDCGCPTQAEVCAANPDGGQITATCENCGNPVVYDCPVTTPTPPPSTDPPTTPPVTDPPTTDPPSTDPPVTDPPVTDPPSTEPPVVEPPPITPPTAAVCGDPDFVPGPGQCSTPGIGNCDANCNITTATADPVCGDPDFVPGPGQCSPPNTANCDATCTPIPASDGDVSIVKSGALTCPDSSGGISTISYTVTVRNIGSTTYSYDDIVDVIAADLPASSVSAVSNSGVITDTGSSLTITWPGGTLAVGESQNFSYTLSLTTAQATSLGNRVDNDVTITSTSSSSEVTFENQVRVICEANPGGLPATNIFGDRNMLFGIAIMAFIMAGIAYNRQLGAQLFAPGVNNIKWSLKDAFNPIKRGSRERFEDRFED